MASDEEALAKSIGLNQFNRDSQETVHEADKLYQPYLASDDRGEQVAMLFRDRTLSGKVGFTYSGQSGEAAANDFIFIARLHNIRAVLKDAPGPHLVTVILDGENAWENYDNDGKVCLSTRRVRRSSKRSASGSGWRSSDERTARSQRDLRALF